MVRDRLPTRAIRGGVLTYVFAALAAASMTAQAASAQHAHQSEGQVQQPQGRAQRTTIVRLSALGLEKAPSDSIQVLVWASGAARLADRTRTNMMNMKNSDDSAVSETTVSLRRRCIQ